MALKVKVKSDLDGVKTKANAMVKLAQYAFVNQVLADSNIYAPMLSGDLRNQSTIALDGKSIIWNVPYARKQYYNQYSNYTTPRTGPKWDQKAKAIHGDSWRKIAKAAMK